MTVKEYAIGHAVGKKINVFYGEFQEIRDFILKLRDGDNDIIFTQVHLYDTEEKMREELSSIKKEWDVEAVRFSSDVYLEYFTA